MTIGEIISEFKQRENASGIFILTEDKKLAEALSIWPNVPVTFDGLKDCDDTDPVKQWAFMWQHAKVDLVTFALILGVTPEAAKTMAARLIGLHMVYPNGDIHRFAQQYLGMLTMSRVNKASRKIAKENVS